MSKEQAHPEGIPQEDVQALKELAAWWRLRKKVEEEHRKSDADTTTTKQRTRRNIYVDDATWEALKKQADHELRSVSDLVREAITLYLGA